MPTDGLRVVVVADTHSNPHPRAYEHIRALKPGHILHAGDVGNLGVLTSLELLAPVSVVRGNIDERKPELPDAATLAFRRPTGSALTVLMTHIGLRGPKLRKATRELAQRERAGLVVCGHSHIPLMGRDDGIVIFNPGSIGPRRFALPIVFGVLEVSAESASLKHIDCETGEEWSPPG